MKRTLSLSLGVLSLLQCAAAGGIVLGSIQGQDGWSGGQTGAIGPSVDQEVTNAAAYAGDQSFRVSNKANNGVFDTWVFGPGLAVAAGQPSSGAAADRISFSLFFQSVNSFADGSNLELDLGNSIGRDRTTFTAITNFADSTGGLTLRAAEPNASGNFYTTNLVSNNLSRTAWHQLDILGFYQDGLANDYFQIFLDDPNHTTPIVSPNTGLNRWATFEAYNAAVSGPYNLSSRLYIRSGADPSGYGPFTAGAVGGFFIDNVSYQTWNSTDPGTILSSYSTGFGDPSGVGDLSSAPEPGSISLLGIGLGILMYCRRASAARSL